MNGPRRSGIIAAIVAKDLREFSRDRLWLVLTPVMLIAYVAIFWLLPSTVDETIVVGVYSRGIPASFDEALGGDAASAGPGLRVVPFDDAEALRTAVTEGSAVELDGSTVTVSVGIAFPDDLAASIAAGQPSTVTIYVDAAVPAEVRTAMAAFVRETTYQIAGVGLPVRQPEPELVVIGVDRAGDQISPQERMRPLLAVFVLIVESMALAGLVAIELQTRTAKAVTATPATVGDLLAAKSVTGMLLAFSQTALLLLLIGAFAFEPLLLLTAVLLGSVMMAGIGMLAGSAGRDFMTTIFIGVVFMVPLAIPAISALFPGAASAWVQLLPTWGVIETIVGVTTAGLGWADALGYLAVSVAWCVVIFMAGWLILRRRVEAL